MEKIFTFSKWFVLFCALLIAARLAWQYVADQVLTEEAHVVGENVFNFDWDENIPGLADKNGSTNGGGGSNLLRSQSKVVEAKVLRRTTTDAQVQISGNQVISAVQPDGKLSSEPPVQAKFSAVLSFFKEKGRWFLSKVEVQ